MENLYFTYLFTLRAVQKAGPLLAALEYSSGSVAEDLETQQLVSRLVRTSCNHFKPQGFLFFHIAVWAMQLLAPTTAGCVSFRSVPLCR